MKLINLLAALSLVLFIGCGGGESNEQEQSEGTAESQKTEMANNVRTIDIIGVDQMKFVIEENSDGVSVGDPVGPDSLLELEGITAEPGEKIRIRLTTQSKLPASAMSHNWLLLKLNADAQEFASAAVKAKANDYVPDNMTDQVIAETGLVPGGETKSVTFTAPDKPGEYDFLCTFPGHFAAGMRGVLTIEEKRPGNTE